ncbi:MAG: lipopolysaccharide kinase InaA family protein [Methylophagaceae bacterium]
MFLIQKKWLIFSPWNKGGEVSLNFSSMDKVFQLEGEIISKGPQSEIFSKEIDGKQFFIKRYFRIKGLGSWLGLSRLRVEARNQNFFNKLGIAAAKVVVYGEEHIFTKTIKGVLVTEGIESVTDLVTIINNDAQKFSDKAWSNHVLLDLAKVVRTLHINRFCHNDLHWRNVLIQQRNENDAPKIFLIDCPSGKRLFWPFLYHRKLKDLASLDKLAAKYLSRTQRLKFYLEYRQINKLTIKDKKMIKGVFARKASRLKRKLKRNL